MTDQMPGPAASNRDKLAGLAQPTPTPSTTPPKGVPEWKGKTTEPAPLYERSPQSPPPYVPLMTPSGTSDSNNITPRNGKGTAALVCGILGLVPFPITGFWLSLIAIILGWQGYKRTQRGEATNEGVAMTGFVLGIIGMGIQFLLSLAIAFS